MFTFKIITPSVKNNETSSLFFTDKSPTERNYEDAKRPNFLSVRCNKNVISKVANLAPPFLKVDSKGGIL